MKKAYFTFLATGVLLGCFTGMAQAISLVNGLGGSAGFGENSLYRNDDGSTGLIDVSSVFGNGLNFFGNNYSSFYVNNNGNITFNNSMYTYTPYGLTAATSSPIIAPFFADVDTRAGATTASPGGNSQGTNLVYWDLDAANGIFTATWDDVGYYYYHTDKLNSFQLQLIDRSDIASGDFDIRFLYEDIQWTTGDASSGSGGLGGNVARAGFNNGDGNYYEMIQSGDQAAMLALENTNLVAGLAPGEIIFEVRNGTVITPPNPVPEPATMLLFGTGLAGFAGTRLRRRKKA